ncbi:hypothetical protein CYY_009450 [Polysphondylium violaceum]|uniref:WD40 repeat-containing protein n=1 Tax=Polysphondylium violaceum TaxID=133409 RepID=A0A8J4PLL7_9MYCE|nr:hypothetical protein CYY_009450 [Polysphondylium violaceum]
MTKLQFPNDDSTKYEIQKWLKSYKIPYTPFQGKDDLLELVRVNKKMVIQFEKDKKKAEESSSLQSPSPSSSLFSSSSSSSSTSTSSYSSYKSKSLSSPFKKLVYKDGKFVQPIDEAQLASVSGGKSPELSKAIRHDKPNRKLNLIDKLVNNTLYVFVSSTFKDMYGERDHLIKVVFPALNVKAKSKNLHIVPIDLRWGLTKEETTVQGQIELCLKQIDKCQIMVAALGSRFGWVPSEYKVSDNKDDAATWLQSVPAGQSITSIEVQYALSKSAEKHCISLLRDPEFQSSVPILHQASFNAENEESSTQLNKLKSLLTSHPHSNVLENYPCKYSGLDREGKPLITNLEVFGNYVFDKLWEIIEFEFPNPIQSLDLVHQENIYHEQFLKKSLHYYGRESFQKKLMDHILDNSTSSIDKIGVVYGEPGSGKSSSLAYFVDQVQKKPDWYVLYHFVGCSVDSTQVFNILKRFSTLIVNDFKIKFEVSDNLEKLRIDFPDLIKRASKSKKILIVIDDLDQLTTSNQSHHMEWLPESLDLSEKTFILTSCDHGKECWDHLHLRSKIPQTYSLNPLEISDRHLITTKTLELYSKKLEPKLLDKLISKTHAKFPLFIKLACEELRVFGTFDKLAMFINKIPDTINQLIINIISRLEEDFGKELIKKTLCFIGLSRFGLHESELLNLLKEKNKPTLPFNVWAPLFNSISPLLRDNNRIITFFHSQIGKVIIGRYLPNERAQITVQNQFVDFYLSQADPDNNKSWSGDSLKPFEELPYHLLKSKRWDLISNILPDLSFIQTKFNLGLGKDLIENYINSLTEIQSPSLSGERWNGYNFSSVNTVEDFSAFIQYQAHHLFKFPHITRQQAFNLPDDSICHQMAEKSLSSNKCTYFKWINKLQISDFVISTLAGHEDFIRSVLYREDGRFIASCSDDKTIRIWSGETGSLIRVFPKVHTDKITNLHWRGNNLVTVSRDKKVILWDEYGKVIQEFIGHTQPVWGVSVSGDGKRIVSASWDQTCIVWDIESKQKVFTLSKHGNKISACAYSRNNKYIATGCWSGVLIIWDAKTGNQITSIKISDFTILFLQFSPDDSMLCLSSVDTFTYVFETSQWKRVAKLEGHTEAVISSRFSGDNKLLVSCSDDKTIRIYDTKEWTQLTVMTGHSGRIISVSFHPNSTKRKIISGATDKFIKVWDPKLGYSGNQAHQGHRKAVSCLEYHQASDTLVSSSEDKTVKLWKNFTKTDLLTLQETFNFQADQFKLIDQTSMIYLQKGVYMVCFKDPKNLVTKLLYSEPGETNCTTISISANHNDLAIGTKLGSVVVIDRTTLKELYRAKLGNTILQLEYSPSGDQLAVCDGKGALYILTRTSKGYNTTSTFTFDQPVCSIAWGTNYFAAGTADNFIHIYDLKRSFYYSKKLTGHVFQTKGLAFCTQLNDKYLYSASLDKQSILWDVEKGTIVSVFPLGSISTSNIIFYKDNDDDISTVLSDYTGKIHHLKLINPQQS